jgi:hypothetical protein
VATQTLSWGARSGRQPTLLCQFMLSSSPTPTEVGVGLCHKPEHRSIGTVYWKSILGGEHSDSFGRTSLVLQLFLSAHQRIFGGSVRYERSMCCSMDIYQCPCQLYKIANFLSPTSAALRFFYDPMTTIQVWEGTMSHKRPANACAGRAGQVPVTAKGLCCVGQP